LNTFFEYPDREHDWASWLRPLLDDLLVIDAPAILVRKTFNGTIAELPVIRGDAIVRYIDVNGFTPVPPNPAYAQNWWGIPLVDLTTEQLVYRPRNIVPRNSVSSQLYGMSPTEQLATEIMIGQQRLQFTLNYYTEGSTPGVIQVVPRGTSPEKISEAMGWMNSELAGNLAARRQWRLVQGFNEPGKPEDIRFTKEPLLADAFDELHIRKICFGYGTSPQRLMKMMNRASAQQADESADIEGLLPWIMWLKGTVDYLIQRIFGYVDYEMVFNPFREADPEKEATTVTTLVSNGILTPNEGREKIGEDARNEPEADQLGIKTGTGFVPLGMAAAMAGSETSESGETTVTPKEEGGEPKKPAAKPNGKAPKEPTKAVAVQQLNATPPGVTSRGVVGFAAGMTLDQVTAARQAGYAVENELDAAFSQPARVVAQDVPVKLAQDVPVKKRSHRPQIVANRLNPQSVLAVRHVHLEIHNALKKMEGKALKELKKIIKKVRKGTDAEDAMLARISRNIEDDWDELPEEIADSLESAALGGAAEGAFQVHVTDGDLLADINKTAQGWARDRAAEMVGKKWDAEGNLIDNPDARWVISETTRDDLRVIIRDLFAEESPTMDSIESRIAQAGVFDTARALMIARTEISRAQNVGNLESWRQSGAVNTVEWQVSGDHDHDDECDEYEAGSPYDIDDAPDLPAHPNCDCILIAGEIEE
jgi:Phage portal protein